MMELAAGASNKDRGREEDESKLRGDQQSHCQLKKPQQGHWTPRQTNHAQNMKGNPSQQTILYLIKEVQ